MKKGADVPHHIQGNAEHGRTRTSQRPQLRVPQQSLHDLRQPLVTQRNSLPPQSLQPLAVHVLVHTCQSGQGP